MLAKERIHYPNCYRFIPEVRVIIAISILRFLRFGISQRYNPCGLETLALRTPRRR